MGKGAARLPKILVLTCSRAEVWAGVSPGRLKLCAAIQLTARGSASQQLPSTSSPPMCMYSSSVTLATFG